MGMWDSQDYSPNEHYAKQAESLLAALEEQQAAMPEVVRQLAVLRSSVTSGDGLATVTVNASGVVEVVEVSRDAFRRSTPDKLGRAIAEAAKSAAHQVRRQADEVVAPIMAATGDLPDLSELVPGAPNLREVRESFIRLPDKPAENRAGPADRDDRW